MDQTTGQKLSKSRVAKGLSVEEVAHATKLRPDKILALEHDDYSRFPNNAYLKGFLQIYGRFLGVDVRATLDGLDNPSPVSITDYQYLNSVPAKEPERLALRRRTGKPSLVPLLVFAFLCAIVGFGGYLYINAKRLGNLDEVSTVRSSSDAGGTTVLPVEKPAPDPLPVAEKPLPAPEKPAAIESPSLGVASDVVAADQQFIAQTGAPEPAPASSVINEVVIEPVRKTWVTVRSGDVASAPVFEDFLYTNAPALKLRGPRFFVQVRDAGAVVIKKNGAPIAYQGPGVTIQ